MNAVRRELERCEAYHSEESSAERLQQLLAFLPCCLLHGERAYKMLRGLLVRTDIKACASISKTDQNPELTVANSPLTSNADVVYRAGISGTQYQRLAVGAERLFGLISIRKRRAQAVP